MDRYHLASMVPRVVKAMLPSGSDQPFDLTYRLALPVGGSLELAPSLPDCHDQRLLLDRQI